jgi:TolB-like protein/Flp pilus assembly protein TadD
MERRLAAILAADVVGYTRLMGADEAGTLERLKSLRRELVQPRITEHKGRIVKLMGDGLLAEFPSVVEAVQCAVDIQQSMIGREADLPDERRIKLRIGVNLGDIIVEGSDIYGDGVNVAARLEGLSDPGGICVSGKVYDEVRNKTEIDFEDLGEQSVKNIAEPIRVFGVKLAFERSEPAPSSATGVIMDRPSIAVLPFANMSGDPEQEYFADGIAEDILTGLSKLRWFFVIARNSSFVYKGKLVDVKRVARELGVRYLLEGSVRKGGTRVRITAQLIDASTGNHIWADRYDGDLTDIFALQDEITTKVVAAIEPKLLEAEGLRSACRSPEDIGAWDMVMQAISLFWRLTKAEGEAAILILERTVERYPDYAPAHSMLAFMLLLSSHMGWSSREVQANQAAASALATRATELDESDPWAHLALGYVAFFKRRTDTAAEEFLCALDLNPNFAAAHGYLGFALSHDGRSDQAIAHCEQAIRMSPHDPQNVIFNAGLAVAHYLAGRYTEAVGFGRKAVQLRNGWTGGHRTYVASLAQAGQIEEARAALARLKELQPNISIAWFERYIPYMPGPMAKFLEGMRKAGLQ